MKSRRRTPSRGLVTQAVELSLMAPQVAMTRLARMASAGASPSKRDRNEFFLLGAEKVTAFYQSWASMWWQMTRMQFEMAQSLATSALNPQAARRVTRSSRAAGARVLSAGLVPVHRRVVANAKRLSRKRK